MYHWIFAFLLGLGGASLAQSLPPPIPLAPDAPAASDTPAAPQAAAPAPAAAPAERSGGQGGRGNHFGLWARHELDRSAIGKRRSMDGAAGREYRKRQARNGGRPCGTSATLAAARAGALTRHAYACSGSVISNQPRASIRAVSPGSSSTVVVSLSTIAGPATA